MACMPHSADPINGVPVADVTPHSNQASMCVSGDEYSGQRGVTGAHALMPPDETLSQQVSSQG